MHITWLNKAKISPCRLCLAYAPALTELSQTAQGKFQCFLAQLNLGSVKVVWGISNLEEAGMSCYELDEFDERPHTGKEQFDPCQPLDSRSGKDTPGL